MGTRPSQMVRSRQVGTTLGGMHNVPMHTVRGTELASAQASRRMRQAEVVAVLAEALPRAAILFRHEDTAPFECDALTAYRTSPMVVVLPETQAQVAAILKICHKMRAPVVARGAGTGLSGGAPPLHAGLALSSAKFNNRKINPASSTAT